MIEEQSVEPINDDKCYEIECECVCKVKQYIWAKDEEEALERAKEWKCDDMEVGQLIIENIASIEVYDE